MRFKVGFTWTQQPNEKGLKCNCFSLLRFSGISKDDVRGTSSSLRDVQKVLLSFINADTFLIGHGLENDLAALKVSC